MKDLVLITAHCPSIEQEEALERCISSVLKSGFHIVLISHTHIPIHIQKKCNYYFYDYLNDISEDPELTERLWWGTTEWVVKSRFFHKFFYGFAIYRMFSMASQVAINFGYEKLHHIEYDCEILDENLLKKHSDLLDKHDSIFYTSDGNSLGLVLGSFKSFKVKSLPTLFSNYNRDEIEKTLKSQNNGTVLTNLTKKLFMDAGNVLFLNENEITEKFKNGQNFEERNIWYTLYHNPKNNTLNIFYRTQKSTTEKVFVIVNNDRIVKFDVLPNTWCMRELGKYDDITNVRIDNGKKIIYNKEFDNNFKRVFKTHAFIYFL